MDLWLVDSILCGRKVNLGFLIVQQIANILAFAYSIILYGILLTTIFQYFEIDLDGEIDISVYKSSNAIDNISISRLSYELLRNQWLLKTTRVPTAIEDESDVEVAMDILSPSHTTAPSQTTGPSSLAGPLDYASAFQNLFERLDTISLDVQQMNLDQQEDMCTLTGNFQAY